MKAKMIPPMVDPFAAMQGDVLGKKETHILRISFALWERLECYHRRRFEASEWKQDALLLGSDYAQTIYGVHTLVDAGLIGESYLLEAA